MVAGRVINFLISILYAVGMGYATWEGFTDPYYNWDILGYTGSVISWQTKDPNAIYTETMAAAKAHLPDYVYTDYRDNPLSSEAAGFVEQLPIYQVKPLYNGAIWLLHQFGFAIPVASWLISAACFGLLSLLLYCWRTRYMSKAGWLILILGLTYLWPWPMYSLSRLSTPDSIATLLEVAALYGWLMRRSFAVFAFLSWLSVLARPDALILCGALAAYFAVFPGQKDRMPRIHATALLAALCATYFLVSHFAGNYGLERWFSYAFIHKTAHISTETEPVTWERYWGVLLPSAVLFLGAGRQVTMIAFSLTACLCYYLKPVAGNRLWMHLLSLIWACVMLRFLMFPAWGDDRYYFVYYLPLLYAGGELIGPCASALLEKIRQQRVSTLRAEDGK